MTVDTYKLNGVTPEQALQAYFAMHSECQGKTKTCSHIEDMKNLSLVFMSSDKYKSDLTNNMLKTLLMGYSPEDAMVVSLVEGILIGLALARQQASLAKWEEELRSTLK